MQKSGVSPLFDETIKADTDDIYFNMLYTSLQVYLWI